ncbi:MAG: hypothetical protein KKB50_12175 [Planctomycetes bacterium]|nr:hypothetical protein [Planctomycetota bacterium]
MFNYDWFHSGGLQRQIEEAKQRCAANKFPDRDKKAGNGTPDFHTYREALETRVILYLKDGLSYEMKEMADVGTNSALAFECTPVDENYQVGAYVIVVPFEDIARVEVFAVHPDEKPQENIRIPGFRAAAAEPQRD